MNIYYLYVIFIYMLFCQFFVFFQDCKCLHFCIVNNIKVIIQCWLKNQSENSDMFMGLKTNTNHWDDCSTPSAVIPAVRQPNAPLIKDWVLVIIRGKSGIETFGFLKSFGNVHGILRSKMATLGGVAIFFLSLTDIA